MEGHYYFGEFLRWNLWFSNPNIAGAFIATILAWVFPYLLLRVPRLKMEWGFYWVLTLLSWGLWFVLIKTYSRGAFLSALVVWLLCLAIICSKQYAGSRKRLCFRALLTVIAIFVLASFSGFLSRVTPTHLANDGSVQARGTLWTGATAMIADAPLTGWGAGQSGQVYMDWYQPIDDTRRYGGTVNSYLFVAAEYGLPILAGVLSLLFCVLLLGWRLAFAGKSTSVFSLLTVGGATASLAVFALCNAFSTLWIFGVLWWAPLAAVLVLFLGLCVYRKVQFMRIIWQSVCLAVFSCFILYGVGTWGGRNIPIKKDGPLIRYGHGSEENSDILCLFDNSVFGPDVGKAVREISGIPAFEKRYLYAAISAKTSLESIDMPPVGTVIISGVRCAEVPATLLEGSFICVVNPLGVPLADRFEKASEGVLMLGSIDEHRQHPRWVVFARDKKWKIDTIIGGQLSDVTIFENYFKNIKTTP